MRPATRMLASSVGAQPSAALMAGYSGPERRHAAAEIWRCIAGAFDEIDYGLLLLDADAETLHVNAAAHAALGCDHPLQLIGGSLHARSAHDAHMLCSALKGAAERGLRKLLTLRKGLRQVCVSVVPLGIGDSDGRRAVVVMLEKRELCANLTLEGFAREHQLTPGETRVLLALCAGARPAQAAREHGVALSTVRTQIKSIRMKTGASSVPALVRWLASLPPLMGVLREGGIVPGASEAMVRMAA